MGEPSFVKDMEGKGGGEEVIEVFWLFWDLPKKNAPETEMRKINIRPMIIKSFLYEDGGGGADETCGADGISVGAGFIDL